MPRANPFLSRNLRGTGAAKVPDYKLKQFVRGLPRLSGSERKELFEKQLRTSYVPDTLRRRLDTLKHTGAAAHHEDPDVRYALQHYTNGGELGREQVERVMRGLLKITDEMHHEDGTRIRFQPGVAPRSSHLEEDTRRSAKGIAKKGLAEKEEERLGEAREELSKRQRRAAMRDPEQRAQIFHPGAAPGLGSSIVSKEEPSAVGSISGYKPGGPDNPANRDGSPAGTPTNPANAGGGVVPITGFHGTPGLSHIAGHALPGESPTHAPIDVSAPLPPAEGYSHSAPSITPSTPPAAAPESPSIGPSTSEPPSAPATPPSAEPPDLEIG